MSVPLKMQFGRVRWASPESWDAGLVAIDSCVSSLSESIQQLLSVPALRPPTHGGSTSVAYRWAVLDAAAWARDVLTLL